MIFEEKKKMYNYMFQDKTTFLHLLLLLHKV